IVGTVVRAGAAVTDLALGDAVGVGAAVHACLDCDRCKAGLDNFCGVSPVFTYNDVYPDADGVKRRDTGARAYGGYASRVRVDSRWAFRLPAGLDRAVAAPLLCAGVTVFAPLKREVTNLVAQRGLSSPAQLRVGVVGIGGLGHLAVQFAAKLGCTVTAISHSPSKKAEATALGAERFINLGDEAEAAAAQGSLDLLLITTFHGSMDRFLGLLDVRGAAVLLAAPEHQVDLNGFSLIGGGKSLSGSLIGSIEEVKATLEFAAAHDVKPMIEKFPMEQVNDAIAHVRKGGPRYRVVLERTASTFA
ncbi:hypothetical protein HK405_010753, partial [Cladochytrium tenue]